MFSGMFSLTLMLDFILRFRVRIYVKQIFIILKLFKILLINIPPYIRGVMIWSSAAVNLFIFSLTLYFSS